MEEPNWDSLTDYSNIKEEFPFVQRPKTQQEIDAEESPNEEQGQDQELGKAA